MNPSKLFQFSAMLSFNRSDMMYLAVSYTAQKKGVYLHHILCNSVVTTSSVSSRDTGKPSEAGRT